MCKQIVTIIVLLVSLSNLIAADIDVVPRFPIAFGNRFIEDGTGFHFDMKAGPSIYIDINESPRKYNSQRGSYEPLKPVFSVLPFIGIHNTENDDRHLISSGIQLMATNLGSSDMVIGISGEMVADSFDERSPGYRVGLKLGLDHLEDFIVSEIAFQDYNSKQIQINLIIDPLAFFSIL